MSSTRSSSPAVALEDDFSMTPRTKLQAMLDRVESSDDDSDSISSKSIATPTKKRTTPKTTANPVDASDDSDQDVFVPRGRLASRMMAKPVAPRKMTANDDDDDDEEEDQVTVRVKRLLIQQRKMEQDTQLPNSTQQGNGIGNGEDDDDDVPVAPYRRQRTPAQDRQSSPGGLFVSPSKPSPPQSPSHHDDSDGGADLDLPSITDPTFALVEKKRKDGLARQESPQRPSSQHGRAHDLSSDDDQDEDGITDDEGGRRLTQTSARPQKRKASKKALEDMNRETQRIQREMQLAHEPMVRKKFTKAQLFEKFNFRPAATADNHVMKTQSPSRPALADRKSDEEEEDAAALSDTPPTSPPALRKDDLSSLEQAPGRAGVESLHANVASKSRKSVRVILPPAHANTVALDDSDDDVLVVRPASKIDRIFDRAPKHKSREDRSLHLLQRLAHKTSADKTRSHGRKNQITGITTGELYNRLAQRVREQSIKEREQRIAELRARGIDVQTREEREADEKLVEDLVARAQKEAEEIRLREKGEFKKEGNSADPLAWDDSEDEEYEGEDYEEEELELSGSDEDDDGEDGQDGQDVEEKVSETESEDDVKETTPLKNSRTPRRRQPTKTIISDDEDEDEDRSYIVTSTPLTAATPNPKLGPARSAASSAKKTPTVLRSATKPFIPGIPVKGAAGLGLTQMFTSTMDDSSQMIIDNLGPTPSAMPDFDHFEHPDVSVSDDEDAMVLDSQPQTQKDTQGVETQGAMVNLAYEQSQMHGLGNLLRNDANAMSFTQMSDMFEPTQEPSGLGEYSPLKERFIAISESAAEAEDAPESPLVRKGQGRRLRRKDSPTRGRITQSTAPMEETAEDDDFGFGTSSAFEALQKAARRQEKKMKRMQRAKQRAKEMVHEQAEESEDEYAGLGGADGEGSSEDEDAASVKEMIDDEGAADDAETEAKLAAFFADRERANDQKQIDQIFRDIQNGTLRRKRGHSAMSDSDDSDGGARRRLKRRQFAKMQRALFADERVKKIAEKPGSAAFLRTMEDRDEGGGGGDDDDDDWMGVAPAASRSRSVNGDADGAAAAAAAAGATIPDSQSQTSQDVGTESRRRNRRTTRSRKPATLGEVRESLSSLLDGSIASAVIPATDPHSADDASDAENDDSAKENDHRWTKPARPAAINRLAIKRGSSDPSSAAKPLAFATSAGPNLKLPSFLLRRATASSSLSSGLSSSGGNLGTEMANNTSSSSGGFGDKGKLKKTAGKRSGLSGMLGAAREAERNEAAEKGEKKREHRMVRAMAKRKDIVGGLYAHRTFD